MHKSMNKIKTIIKELVLGAIILFIFINIVSYIRKPILESKEVPAIQATLVDATVYKQKEGKPLLIHFWGTWCPTCKLEAPNIEQVSKNYEVLSIAVNSGSDEKIQAYMSDNGLSFSVLNDTEAKWAEKFNVEVYPTTFIYDSKGKLQFTEVGYTSTLGLFARLKMIEK